MRTWILVLILLLSAAAVSAQTSAHPKSARPSQIPVACGLGPQPAILPGARGLAVDRLGDVYIADTGNNLVEKVPPSDLVCAKPGDCTLVAYCQTPSLGTPESVAVDQNLDVYIGYNAGSTGSVLKVPHNDLTCARGDCINFATDMKSPYGLAVDRYGNVYIADENSGKNVWLEKPVANGKCNQPVNGYCEIAIPAGCSIAGTCKSGPAGAMNAPSGIAVDQSGHVYIAVNGSGVVLMETRVAGTDQYDNEMQIGPPPGQPNHLNAPFALATDTAGDLFITDWGKPVTGGPVGSQVLRIKMPAHDPTCATTNDCAPVGSGIFVPYGVAAGRDGSVYVSASSIPGSKDGIVKIGP